MYSKNDQLTKSFNELQSDVLGEKLTSNPLMKASGVKSKNKALKTTQKTIVNAINELLEAQDKLTTATLQDLAKMYSALGEFGKNEALFDELKSRGADSILALAARTYDDVQATKNLVQDDYEDVFHIAEGETQSEFVLTYKPVGKIRMYIDGIRYFKECIDYNPDTNTVKWINDASQPEGFDITDADVVFEYDYDSKEEGEKSGTTQS